MNVFKAQQTWHYSPIDIQLKFCHSFVCFRPDETQFSKLVIRHLSTI